MSEYLRFIKIRDEKNSERDSKIYIYYENGYKFVLQDGHTEYLGEGDSYTQALSSLLEKMEYDTELVFINKVVVVQEKSKFVIEINECVRRALEPFENQKLIEFKLSCNFNGITIATHAFEDFSISFYNLIKQIQGNVECCATCNQGDFKSDGAEDLRHGWFCFRDVDVSLQIPWFERLESFEVAVPNVDAFHWCPEFQFEKKY